MLEVPCAVLPSRVSEELMFAPALVTVSIEDPLEVCTPVVLQPWNQPSPQGALVDIQKPRAGCWVCSQWVAREKITCVVTAERAKPMLASVCIHQNPRFHAAGPEVQLTEPPKTPAWCVFVPISQMRNRA